MKTLKQLWNKYNPFDIGKYFDSLSDKLDNVQTCLGEVREKLDRIIKNIKG